MKPTHQMIHALRRTAHKLMANQCYYQWSDPSHCNCGTLLNELKGDKYYAGNVYNFLYTRVAKAFESALKNGRAMLHDGWWYRLDHLEKLAATCSVTGKHIDDVLAELEAYGFEPNDWYDIEFAGTNHNYFTAYREPSHVAQHLLKRAEELAVRRRALAEERLARMKARRLAQTTTDEQPRQTVNA